MKKRLIYISIILLVIIALSIGIGLLINYLKKNSNIRYFEIDVQTNLISIYTLNNGAADSVMPTPCNIFYNDISNIDYGSNPNLKENYSIYSFCNPNISNSKKIYITDKNHLYILYDKNNIYTFRLFNNIETNINKFKETSNHFISNSNQNKNTLYII